MKPLFTRIQLLFVLISSTCIASAQVGWDTLPWKSYADYRLQMLDKSYVTTGILYDRMLPVARVENYAASMAFGHSTNVNQGGKIAVLTNKNILPDEKMNVI